MASDITTGSISLGDDRIDQWWRDHAEVVYRYAVRRVGPTRAEDVCAQTFVVAWERRTDFDSARAPRPWLLGIASNLIRRELRTEERALRAYARTGVDPMQSENTDHLVDRLDAAAAWPAVAEALSDLKPTDREMLWLVVVGELTYAEVAECLDVPVGTVRSRLSRARSRLRSTSQSSGGLQTGDPS